MKKEEEEYLQKIYTDPKQESSFSGINSLLRKIRKDGKYDISKEKLKKWLEGNETYTLHRPLQRTFSRNRVVVGGINIEWDLDLADMALLKSFNRDYAYFMVAIDDFSKHLYTYALKSKSGTEVTKGMNEILKLTKDKPDIIRCDQGAEFANKSFQTLLKKNNIRMWTTQNEKKANIAERCIKTIKNRIYRHFTLAQDLNWIDILQELTDSYNKTYHRSIGMSPNEVNKENEDNVWRRLYPLQPLKIPERFKFNIDDKVRISVLRKTFEREYDIKWSIEFFIITDRYYKSDIAKYKLKDYNNEEIMGSFYEEELQKINIAEDEIFKIDHIVKRRTRNGKSEILVQWWGWPPKFNSWIPESELQNYN